MLRATFQHLVRGINAEREAALWKKGILSWEDFEKRHPIQKALFLDSQPRDDSPFSVPRAALDSGDAKFFADALHRREHYRIALELPKRTVFLDIETTGLSRHYDVITLVGWCYQGNYQILMRGQDDAHLRAVLGDAQVIVTFNGSLFDLPFLRTGFADLRLPPAHVDLRFLAKRIGLSGGQKPIEEILGFKRSGEVSSVRGETRPCALASLS